MVYLSKCWFSIEIDVHGVTIISIVKTIIKNINITPKTKSDSNCDELRFFKRNSRAFDDETTCRHQRMCRVTGVGRPTSVSLDNCYGLSQGVWVFLSILGIPNSPNSPWVSIRSHGMSWPSMTTWMMTGGQPLWKQGETQSYKLPMTGKGSLLPQWMRQNTFQIKCCNDGNLIITNLPFTDGSCIPFIVILGVRVSPRQDMNIFLSSHLLASMVRMSNFFDFQRFLIWASKGSMIHW